MLRASVLFFCLSLNFCLLTSASPNDYFEICGVEICDNGIDDDGDGLIDLNDDDCQCMGSLDTLLIPSSLIPNPSFEDTLCCPDNLAQLTCAQSWIQASDATSDYFNSCGFTSDRYRTIPPQPLPAGEGYVGFRDEKNYKEYVGTCLTNYMQYGVPYMLELYVGFGKDGDFWKSGSPFNLSIFGTADCLNIPFGGPGYVSCPLGLNDWFEIATEVVVGYDEWVKVSIEFTLPIDVNAIVVGPSCDAPVGENFYYLDNLVLAESAAFQSAELSIQGSSCDQVVTLTGQKYRGVTYQWYRDGIAIMGATKRIYKIRDFKEGNYQLRMSVAGECFLSNSYEHIINNVENSADTTMCIGDFIDWEGQQITKAGRYVANYKRPNGCDSILVLNVTEKQVDEWSLDTSFCRGDNMVIGGQTFDKTGSYRVELLNQQGCDSTINLYLTINESYLTYIDTQLCDGQIVQIGGQQFSSTGRYDVPLWSKNGCDSVVRLNLEILESTVARIDTAMCVSDVIEIAGQSFDAAGQYRIRINNQAGCDSTIYLNIDVNTNYEIAIDTTLCRGEILNIDQNSWSEQGVYTLNMTSNSGCDSITVVRLNYAEDIVPTIDLIRPISCNNTNDAAISLRTTGGYGNLSYLWNTGAQNRAISNLPEGNYSVKIIDELGCRAESNIYIINPEVLEHELVTGNPTCADPDGGRIELGMIKGGTPPYKLSIDGSFLDEDTMKVYTYGPGYYEVEIIDAHGCANYETIQFLEPGLGDIEVSSDKETYVRGETVQLDLEMIGINAPIQSINWFPKNIFNCSNCTEVETRIYLTSLDVDVEVTDENGCIYTRSIKLKANAEYFVPNVFTPNGDGINDFFEIYTDGKYSTVRSFEVFSRWGEKIYGQYNFRVSDPSIYWDGTFFGKEMPSATYIYRIELEDHIGNMQQISGDITLIR